jgi:hypothetical protein
MKHPCLSTPRPLALIQYVLQLSTARLDTKAPFDFAPRSSPHIAAQFRPVQQSGECLGERAGIVSPDEEAPWITAIVEDIQYGGNLAVDDR